MSNKIAIKVDNVSKDFVLQHQSANSLKSFMTGFYKKNTKKSTEVQRALKNISFDIKEGEFFGIVGRNGSGKSTLLKILAGIYQPTKGSISVKGKLVPFIELGVGFNPELTGRENVYLNGALLGFDRKQVDAMYEDIVSFAELEKFMDQKLKNYSSGMQVRLAFSMATRSDADVLLIDEVLAVGDTAFQRKCFEYFRSLKKNKKTVVFVSHDMDAIKEYCDRVVLIEDSKLAFQGNPDDVAQRYKKLFLNSETHEAEQTNDRWGQSVGIIKDVKTTPRLLTNQSKPLAITIRVSFLSDEDAVVVGYLIKNSAGVSITGNNSKILNERIDRCKAGDNLEFNFEVANIFSEGGYTIDIGITSADGTILEWWEGASMFNVVNDNSSHHLVSPPSNLIIKRQ